MNVELSGTWYIHVGTHVYVQARQRTFMLRFVDARANSVASVRLPREEPGVARAHTELETRHEGRVIERKPQLTTVWIDLAHRCPHVAQRGEGGVVGVLVDEQHGAVGIIPTPWDISVKLLSII